MSTEKPEEAEVLEPIGMKKLIKKNQLTIKTRTSEGKPKVTARKNEEEKSLNANSHRIITPNWREKLESSSWAVDWEELPKPCFAAA